MRSLPYRRIPDARLFDKDIRRKGKVEDIGQLKRISYAMQKASLCGLGQTASNPILSTLKYFEMNICSIL